MWENVAILAKSTKTWNDMISTGAMFNGFLYSKSQIPALIQVIL